MRMSVKLKFNDAQGKIVDQFSREIGLSVDEFCKRAVFYSINDSYKRAELIKQKMELQEEANNLKEHKNAVSESGANNPTALELANDLGNNAATGDTGTDTQEAHVSESTDSPALPESSDTNTNSET